MDLSQYTIEQLIEFATKYLDNKKKRKSYIQKYRESKKGRENTRKASLSYYYRKKKLKS